jgi:hypothetical protein
MAKSNVRKNIERILGLKGAQTVFVDATDSNKSKYRMKIVLSGREQKKVTKEQIRQIQLLPNVLECKIFTSTKKTYYQGYFDGIAIYFAGKPSQSM